MKSTLFVTLKSNLTQTPITCSLILLSLLTSILCYVHPDSLYTLIFIDPHSLPYIHQPLQYNMPGYLIEKWYFLKKMHESSQYWRMVTPVLLHFSLSHIAFNLAVFYYLAKKIEIKHGSILFLCFFLILSISSNAFQYIASFSVFGGLSGVVYGLTGVCWIRETFKKDYYQITPGFYTLSLIWLIFGFIDIFSSFLGNIANAAHLSGLLTGLVIGIFIFKKG